MNLEETRRQWAERSGEFSPEYYAYYGPDGTSERVLGILDRYLDRDARVLELGCSSGRHLAHLHDHGFTNLSGIDLNADAFEVMAATYPDLAEAVTFYHGAIEDIVGGFEDRRFGAVYSVQTLQHVHPDSARVFEELARITDGLLVTVENEGDRGSGVDGGNEDDRESRSGNEGEHEDGNENADRDDRARPTGAGVNYVNGEFPLYYRDWGRVFADSDLVEIEVSTEGRDTVRVFRSTGTRSVA